MHGGGMDLMFPHHENELAQIECATGKPFVKYWMHNGLTRIKTKLGQRRVGGREECPARSAIVVSARELIDKHGADLLRYLLLSTHYRRPIEFTDEVIAKRRRAGVFTRCSRALQRRPAAARR
jgi:cysteinyl-tRNA synthetase